MPAAKTTISTPPNRFTAASTILSQSAAELGRILIASTLAPSFSQSAVTFFSASAPPAESTTLQPAPASTCAASAPNAPVPPVTTAVLPLTSKSDSGFFKKSSVMDAFSLYRRDGHRDGADIMAAIDDLAALVRTDVAAIALLDDTLLAAGDHREFAGQHVIDLLRRRCVGAGAAARQKMRNA